MAYLVKTNIARLELIDKWEKSYSPNPKKT